jgi:DNA-binding beta-propeller fold protein YncE
MSKRALSQTDGIATETGTTKKTFPQARTHITPLDLDRLSRDPDCFFSAVPRDITIALAAFIRWRRGWVCDPGALRFDRIMEYRPFCFPRLLCFDHDDNILLPLSALNEVHAYDRQGRFVREVGRGHYDPVACVVDSLGRVYVSEYDLRCVYVFSASGSLERVIDSGNIHGLHGLALNEDDSILYVAAGASDVVKSYRTDTGAFLCDIFRVQWPFGVVVLSCSGHIAVTTHHNRSGAVHIFTPTGIETMVFGVAELTIPRQIAVDAADNLYVANETSNTVVVYSSVDGRVIGKFGSGDSSAADFLEEPLGVAIDSTGAVAVAERSSTRVHFFKSA